MAAEATRDHAGVCGAAPLLVLPATAVLARAMIPDWMFMWAMAGALFAGCKWLSLCDATAHQRTVDWRRAFGYLAAWPGMDARAFLTAREPRATRPFRIEWVAAGLKTLLGAAMTWLVARTAWPEHPLVAGWLGMIGLVFLLHFGTFHLLSLAWRTTGVDAVPVMRSPLRSTSLAEFWARRWNTAFHELAERFTFRPLRRVVGATAASLLAFLLSGLIHELVISLPAGEGFGLPTGYFLVQGMGVATERTHLGRQLGLGQGWRGWLFTVLITAGPAFWLFHPPFISHVILPMLTALGAI